jgi:radical SAM superfamily enzyme YgiQ (UPF0313 family)
VRVLFIYPNIDCPPGINHGLVAMSGVLKAHGHEVGLIHVCENLWELPTTEEVLDRIEEFAPDIVGFSVMSQQFEWACSISRALRSRKPELPQAVGGVHCTMVPDEVTATELFDWVFVGECDHAFAELVDRMRDGGELHTVPNTRVPARYSPTGEVLLNPVGAFPDLFTLNRDYVLQWTKAYRESGIGLPFVVNAHVQCFDDEMAASLASAGCIIVKYGLESGSARVRQEVLWRFMTNSQIERMTQTAHRHSLHTSAFVMIGLPHETREEVFETLRLCATVKNGRFRWAIFYPFPGTAGYTIAKQADLIDWEKWSGMGNYFDASCLRFDDEHDLLIEKVGALCPWYVNALTDWPCSGTYTELVRELEAMDRETFRRRRAELIRRDRELSEELLRLDIPHYSIRYSHVMGVRSDFVSWERRQSRSTREEQAVAYTLD